MIFQAKYTSRCACGEMIMVGDTVKWVDRYIAHVDCDDIQPVEGVTLICPVCFQAQAANATCGCDPR